MALNTQTKKIMIYSHEDSGFSDTERLLAISESFIASDPDLSVLVVSGSPMIQTFRNPKHLDYIKLPALSRGTTPSVLASVMGNDEIIRFRSRLIHSAVRNFRPDLFIVDKEPNGVQNELSGVLKHIKQHQPEIKQALLMGNPDDTTEASLRVWDTLQNHQAVEHFYDLVMLTGSPDMVDAKKPGWIPALVEKKVQFCLDSNATSKIRELILDLIRTPQPQDEAANLRYPAETPLTRAFQFGSA